jgi:micrococcal nuclease
MKARTSAVVIVLIAVILVVIGCSSHGQTFAGRPLLKATVTRVVDGDTIYVSIAGKDEPVRFIGVDTPETAHPTVGEEPYGEEASAYTKRNLTGRKVWLEFDVQERDKYGRLLAYVWLDIPKGDSEPDVRAKMFNARLLLDGYAQTMTIPPNVKYAEMFLKLQREARDNHRGLWGERQQKAKTGEVVNPGKGKAPR